MITLTHSTRLAFQVVLDDDTNTVANFLFALTALIGLLLTVGQLVLSIIVWVNDFIEASRFASIILMIAFKAVAFGIGIRL